MPSRASWSFRGVAAAHAGEACRLLPLVAVALFLRTWFQRATVLAADGTVRFPEYDAYHHMRLVDALLHDFPYRLHFDVYGHFGGEQLRSGPLLDLLVAGVSLLVGGGAPSPALVDHVAAWTPSVLGALAVLPVYALGRLLFGRPAALAAAALFAVLPGGLLRRTSFGFVDHHALEVLLTPLVLFFLALAVRRGEGAGPGVGRPAGGGLLVSRLLPAAWLLPAVAAGLALGAYLLSWTSGTFLVAILLLWLGIDLLTRAWRGEPWGPPAAALAVAAAVALPLRLLHVGALAGAEVGAAALAATSVLALALVGAGSIACRRSRPARLAILIAVLAVPLLGAAVLRPDALRLARGEAARLLPTPVAETVFELRPLAESPERVWRELATALPFAVLGLGLAAPLQRRERQSDLLLASTFAVATLAATLLQQRFSAYFALAAALFGGYAFIRLLELARRVAPTGLARVVSVVVLGALLFVPTAFEATRTARIRLPSGEVWFAALAWLRTQTPEPFGDPASYYRRFPPPPPGSRFRYPASAYSVLAWWDFGYWIQRIGRRIPVANPAQAGVDDVAAFLLAGDPAEARAVLERNRVRYVMVDSSLTVDLGAWYLPAVAQWAGRPFADFMEVGKVRQPDGSFVEVMVLYPAYYQTMAVRLWSFGGHEVTPNASTWLMRSELVTAANGTPFREITGLGRFATYEDAVRARATPAYRDTRIVGLSFADSPVPLAPLPDLALVYASPQRVLLPGTPVAAPALQIFEYRPTSQPRQEEAQRPTDRGTTLPTHRAAFRRRRALSSGSGDPDSNRGRLRGRRRVRRSALLHSGPGRSTAPHRNLFRRAGEPLPGSGAAGPFRQGRYALAHPGRTHLLLAAIPVRGAPPLPERRALDERRDLRGRHP